MSCALFKFELFVRDVLDTDFVFVNWLILLCFLLDSVLCHVLTCRVLKCNAISKQLTVSWCFCSCILNNFDGNLYCQYVLQCYYGVTIIILCMFVYKVD